MRFGAVPALKAGMMLGQHEVGEECEGFGALCTCQYWMMSFDVATVAAGGRETYHTQGIRACSCPWYVGNKESWDRERKSEDAENDLGDVDGVLVTTVEDRSLKYVEDCHVECDHKKLLCLNVVGRIFEFELNIDTVVRSMELLKVDEKCCRELYTPKLLDIESSTRHVTAQPSRMSWSPSFLELLKYVLVKLGYDEIRVRVPDAARTAWHATAISLVPRHTKPPRKKLGFANSIQ
jgi:hypothetical protein